MLKLGSLYVCATPLTPLTLKTCTWVVSFNLLSKMTLVYVKGKMKLQMLFGETLFHLYLVSFLTNFMSSIKYFGFFYKTRHVFIVI